MRLSRLARPSHQVACAFAAASRLPNACDRASSSPIQTRAKSSRTLAQRSSISTARRSSKDGATLRAQSEPSSDSTSCTSSASRSAVGLGHAGVGQPELAEQVTRSGGEYAVLAGDRRGDLVERSGVDHRALATTGRRHRDLDAQRLADRLDGVVDDSGEVLEVDAEAEVAATGRGPVAETRGQLGLHVGDPAGAELPGVPDPVGDRGGLRPGRAGELAQLSPARPR